MSDPDIFKSLEQEKDDILQFVQIQLSITHPRGDYKELLELCAIFLGHSFPNYNFKPPGAMHRARWMSKIIYAMKMFIFRSEFEITTVTLNELKQFLIFICKVYIKSWFSATSAPCAPNNDLNLIKKLDGYKIQNAFLSSETLKTFGRHLWYLSPQLAVMALFDNEVTVEVKTKMINNLKNKKCNKNENRIAYSEQILKMELQDFISSESKQFFKALRSNFDFLCRHRSGFEVFSK